MRFAALLLFLSLAACGPQPAGKPVTRIELDTGKAVPIAGVTPAAAPMQVKIAADCERVVFEQIPLTHCIADPKKHRITTALGPKDGKPYRSLAALAAGRRADAASVAFAINGGMYDGGGKPIGYYVEHGKRLQELSQTDGSGNFHMKPNGVFYGTGSSWHIKTSEDFYHLVGDRPDFGTQSGPMLVIDGKLHPQITQDGPSRAIRDGVGVDTRGRAHFVISNAPLSFGKLARYFRDVLKTPNALYLDGKISALWDPATGRLDNAAAIGPMIVVENRN